MFYSTKNNIWKTGMKVYLLILATCFFLLNPFSSCRKEIPLPDRTPHYAPQELKDYCYFLPGTYWIYKDSATGTEDSVYVVAAANGIDTVYDSEGKLQGIFEWFTVQTVSSYDGYNYDYNFSASWSSVHGDFIFRIKSKPGGDYGNTICFLMPLVIGTSKYSIYSDGIITLTGIYNSINVNGNYFYEIIEFNDSKNSTENNENTLFYFSKKKGIIKKKLLTNPNTWELVRYNIIQQ